jgi:2-desacetyl-2-hydroxyethyl bacteriochlorophyllide A dehydrogenase
LTWIAFRISGGVDVNDVQTVEGVWLVAPGRVEVAPVEVRPPGPDDVQVDVRACGICTGDVFKFQAARQEAHRFHAGERQQYPIHFGHEGVGVVHAVGDQVRGIEPGDKVGLLGNGHYAQRVNVPAGHAFVLPDDVEAFEAWILEPVACVVNALQSAEIRPGDRVLLIGCGFMGTLLLQGLKRTLASAVMVAEIDAARLELAGRYAPTSTFHVEHDDELQRLREVALAAPFDVVIEAAGSEPALALAGDVLRRGGTLVMYSWQHGPRQIDTTQWHLGGFRVLNASPFISDDFAAVAERAVRLLAHGAFDLRPLLTHVVGYRDAQQAFEAAVARSEGYIKGVLRF